jgi:hypothetical protein
LKHSKNIDLCIDTMMVNNIPFLTTISKRIKYRTPEFVPNKTMSAYRSALERVYQSAGFRINTVSCDNEFKPLLEDMKSSWNFRPNYASAQEHVPEAEHNNRVIKERIRAIYHSIPFNNLPRILIKALVIEATRKLNYFAPKGGVSAYYSPCEILHQVKLDYQKHCRIPQFSYTSQGNLASIQEHNTTHASLPEYSVTEPIYQSQDDPHSMTFTGVWCCEIVDDVSYSSGKVEKNSSAQHSVPDIQIQLCENPVILESICSTALQC